MDLEESLSLDELVVLYEMTLERQSRAMRTLAAAMGGGSEDDSSMIQYVYSDSDSPQSERKYTPSYMVDPKRGGEVEPIYGEEQIQQLPINVGYSIINSEQ